MSKLNPQNATAYVGPGVLRKGGKITPVPNGPLIKKKGPFKGSTLKAGGKIKKAMMGMGSIFKDNPIYKKTTDLRGKLGSAALGMPGMKPIVKNGSKIKKAQEGLNLVDVTPKSKNDTIAQKPKPVWVRNPNGGGSPYVQIAKKMNKKKAGGMIKRADGSMSKRGLWDNIRANKGSGKKPTAEMLKQERKIKAKK